MSTPSGSGFRLIYNRRGELLQRVEGDSLINATLYKAELTEADLCGADLTGAYLGRALLANANLAGAKLDGVDLDGAELAGANLTGASLRHAHLLQTHFRGADLSCADLSEADIGAVSFVGSTLVETNLENAALRSGYFLACTTLCEAKGLEAVRHIGPSYLDAITLRACTKRLPDVFLLGVGYTPFEVENLRAMYSSGIEFYSCFLSYARKDAVFADRLHADLIQAGVSCWQDVHDMKGGRFFREQIRDQIRLRDKVVVVCSEESILRTNVVEEIVIGMEDERRSGDLKLFPIRLDDFIFSSAAEQIAQKLPANLRREDWLGYLRNYHLPDFSCWESPEYRPAFEKLLGDLKAKPSKS